MVAWRLRLPIQKCSEVCHGATKCPACPKELWCVIAVVNLHSDVPRLTQGCASCNTLNRIKHTVINVPAMTHRASKTFDSQLSTGQTRVLQVQALEDLRAKQAVTIVGCICGAAIGTRGGMAGALSNLASGFTAAEHRVPVEALGTWISLSLLRRSRSTAGHISSQVPTMAPARIPPSPPAVAKQTTARKDCVHPFQGE